MNGSGRNNCSVGEPASVCMAPSARVPRCQQWRHVCAHASWLYTVYSNTASTASIYWPPSRSDRSFGTERTSCTTSLAVGGVRRTGPHVPSARCALCLHLFRLLRFAPHWHHSDPFATLVSRHCLLVDCPSHLTSSTHLSVCHSALASPRHIVAPYSTIATSTICYFKDHSLHRNIVCMHNASTQQ